MKLANIYATKDIWTRLTAMRMKPATAYRLLKYGRLIEAESAVVEQQRVALIYQTSGAKPGENVRLEPGTDAYKEFVEKFNALLDTDCELKPMEANLEDLMAEMDGEAGNALSAQDLAAVEPFFAAAAQ